MTDDPIDSLDVPILFGRFLILSGLVTEDDMVVAAAVQRDLNASPLLTLLEQGILTVDALGRARRYQREHMVPFCQATEALGIMSAQDCAAALDAAAGHRMQIGDVLVRQGKISREQLEAALRQHRRHQESRGAERTAEDHPATRRTGHAQ